MCDGERGGAGDDELAPGASKVLGELTDDPGRPPLDALTRFVEAVQVKLYAIARDRSRPLDDRLGAVAQLGREARAAGGADDKGVRPRVRELLGALASRERADADADSAPLLAALERALGSC